MRRFLPLVLLAVMLAVAPTSALAGGKGGGCGKGCDRSSPSVTIDVPASGSMIAGTVLVSGRATDNKDVSAVAIRIDGGGFFTANGTTSWTTAVDTTGFADGSHTITARATDPSGNSTSTSITVWTQNEAAVDANPPSVSIATPQAGTELSGTVTIAGVASDDTQLANVKIRIDGVNAAVASGTTTWNATIDSTQFADGSHQLAAVATDTAGNSSQASEPIAFANAVVLSPSASPSPTASPTASAPPTTTERHLVTPEGVTIDVAADVPNWTAQQVYDILLRNAMQLSVVGPTLNVKVQLSTSSSTTASAASINGVYSAFKAVVYLGAAPDSTFTAQPDRVVAHEYGHAWSLYHLYLTEQADWSGYLTARGIATDPRLESNFKWSKREIIADDYRLLFGSQAAIDEAPQHLNTDITDPRLIPGLRDFLLRF
jgi:Big-like domain-containing protein